MSTSVLQVVSSDGQFLQSDVEDYFRSQSLTEAGLDYQIVAVTGPQSSGKSTLMNALFGTDFQEMNAFIGRQQTTKGIWLAKSTKVTSPLTLVMDLEGSDGRERGEDDNSFERQSSLFALAITNILVVNMWAKDIGREAGAGKPLLKTIFQVNLKLFAPSPHHRRTVLLFVFRDKTKTPLKRLIETWEEDLHQMWASITKPAAYEDCSFTDLFQVEYATLPNFEEKEDDFRTETYLLQRRFDAEEAESLVTASTDQLPGSTLALSMGKLWQVIKEQRDLNLPAHKVMVATVRCAELAATQLRALESDQACASLQQQAASGIVPGFAASASSLLDSCLSGYDEEARYFEEGVRTSTGMGLKAKALELLKPSFLHQLTFLREATLQHVTTSLAHEHVNQRFAEVSTRVRQEALDTFLKGAQDAIVTSSDWDASSAATQLQVDIDAQIEHQKETQVASALQKAQADLKSQINRAALPLFESCPQDLWQRAQVVVDSSVKATEQAALKNLAGFQLPAQELESLASQLSSAALSQVDALARTAAETVLIRMNQRFSELFAEDEDGIPRNWAPKVSIPSVTNEARKGAAQVMALLAANRLDHTPDAFESIDRTLSGLTAEARAAGEAGAGRGTGAFSRAASRKLGDLDLLASDEWPGVPADAVLLQPDKCRTVWKQFCVESSRAVSQAVAVQDMRKATSSRMPPLWAIAAMMLLGWNEFVTVLYNPLWLVMLVLVGLFGKTVYDELEVDAELQRGLLPGALALSHKFVPTMKRVARHSFQAIAEWVKDPQALRASAANAIAAASQHTGLPERARSVGHPADSQAYELPASANNSTATATEGGEGVRLRARPKSVQMTDLRSS